MEAGGHGIWQSGNPSPSSNVSSPFDRRPRGEGLERPPYREGPAMATATIISPTGPFQSAHHNAYPTSYPYSAPPISMPGMISPVESRRSGDDCDVPPRQSLPPLPSLPSLHEALGGKHPGPQYAPGSAGPAPPPLFPSPATSRSFGDSMSDKAPSPMSIHSIAPKFSRPDSLPSAGPTRRPVPPPIATFAASNSSPAYKMDPMDVDRRSDFQHHQKPHQQQPLQQQQQQQQQQQPQLQQQSPDYPPSAHPLSANPQSAHPHSATQTASLYPHPPGRLPPGQLALPNYPPMSPHNNGAPLPSPRDSQQYRQESCRQEPFRQGPYRQEPYRQEPYRQEPYRQEPYRQEPYRQGDEPEFGHNSRGSPPAHKSSMDRAFQAFNYDESLQLIQSTARTLFTFAEAYTTASREQIPDRMNPARMPSENEVSALINSAVMIQCKLEHVRDMIQATRINSERAQGNGSGGRKGGEDEEAPVYSDGLKHFQVAEIKKRRGRAAPPGRCHSCNRMDTPEWRRGPDGARTLCNACGLHYAKLERRRQLQDRSTRPKSSGDRH